MAHAWRGAIAGIVGGVVFGIVMAATGMLSMVAMLVGGDDAVTGGVVHLAISAAFGVVFGLLAGLVGHRMWTVMASGLIYGVALWVIGWLVLMPALLGMPLFPMDQMSMWSLFGHVLYGLVAGATLYGLSRKGV
jgi:uncharacterized membrane protein YagU involved in acid resistance